MSLNPSLSTIYTGKTHTRWCAHVHYKRARRSSLLCLYYLFRFSACGMQVKGEIRETKTKITDLHTTVSNICRGLGCDECDLAQFAVLKVHKQMYACANKCVIFEDTHSFPLAHALTANGKRFNVGFDSPLVTK